MSIYPDDKDVIGFTNSSEPYWADDVYKPQQLMKTLLSLLSSLSNNTSYVIPFFKSINCELLQPGGKWITGSLRLRLEFIPDELDEQEAQLLLPPSENMDNESKN